MFSNDEMRILSMDHNNINPDDPNFDKDDLKTNINSRLMTWHNKLKQRKTFKKL